MQHRITPNNIHSFCRTCLNELQQKQTTYNIQAMDMQIRQWLEDAQQPNDDSLPLFVCQLCRDKMECFLEFNRMCSRTRRAFQDILAKNCNSRHEWELSEMPVDADELDNGADGVQVNCEWLDFDFVAIPKSQAELQRKTCNRHLTKMDEPIALISRPTSPKTEDSCNYDEEYDHRLHGGEHIKKDINQETENNSDTCENFPAKSVKSTNRPTNAGRKSQTNQKFKKKSSRQRRRQTAASGEEKPATQHVCEECGKVFEKLKQLEKHQYTHKPPEEHPFFCAVCNKIYKSQQTFKEHQLRHSGIKNFECPYCGVKKTTKNELQTHLNYHTKERQYLCPNCPMIFSRVSNFRRHDEVVHQGLRRYICRYCDQAFGKPNTLKHHEMIHTGEKPHQCCECGKRFRQQVQLTTHMKVHNKQSNQQKSPPKLIHKEIDLT